MRDLEVHPVIIMIVKNHKGKISIEFPESANLEKSYFSFQKHDEISTRNLNVPETKPLMPNCPQITCNLFLLVITLTILEFTQSISKIDKEHLENKKIA